MVKPRGRPSWACVERIVRLLLMVTEEVVKLIDAIRH